MKIINCAMGVVCLLGAVACGSSGELTADDSPDQLDPNGVEGAADPASEPELGTVEQAFGEGTCATATPTRNSALKGSGVSEILRAPYDNAACRQSLVVPVQVSGTATRITVDIAGSITVSGTVAQQQAQCAAARLRVQYFSKGQLVASFDKTGGRLNNGCTVLGIFALNNAASGVSRSGDTVTIGPAPVQADNARFAIQALNQAGAIQTVLIETL